ncbi:DmsE family decaheme c-type cytochrome [Uliginosibacterium sp. 31-12]|uniref:DmsE family decaheme c-type cytochrome n=1 Tax=Uliginosibacterium sp. 31-12 TaxID=3062781 RepID=UPI0026E34B97|nr:DmsE family decaheme c-type cytochrome [Uliginosibacterium sp. 31-12]MDO6386669.1 DmsE family decaheme c-type cytochrome [Uliginosibacterium sp. 31-12]
MRKLMGICVLLASLVGAADLAAAEPVLPDLGSSTSPARTAEQAVKRDAVCTRCHDEDEPMPVLSIYQTKHGVKGDPRAPSCQACHGESDKHVKVPAGAKERPAPDVVFKKGAYKLSEDHTRADQCLSCHKASVKHNNWTGSQHPANGVSCNDCHVAHTPRDKVLSKMTQPEVCYTCHKEQRADSHKISAHPITVGKTACSDCHNSHGGLGPKMLKKATLNETCYLCHADKRGPMLFEHQPVVEDCAACHTPHGSNISPLLKSRSPILCDECHDGPHISRTPIGPNAAGRQGGFTGANISGSATGRACMNCHVQVHGSNSPAGGYLLR